MPPPVMFAKMVGKLGARYYRVDGLTQFLGRVFKPSPTRL